MWSKAGRRLYFKRPSLGAWHWAHDTGHCVSMKCAFVLRLRRKLRENGLTYVQYPLCTHDMQWIALHQPCYYETVRETRLTCLLFVYLIFSSHDVSILVLVLLIIVLLILLVFGFSMGYCGDIATCVMVNTFN